MRSIHELIRPIQRRTRGRRMQQFKSAFDVMDGTEILDVGGTPQNWDYLDVKPRITLLNVWKDAPFEVPANMRYVHGDGRTLPFGDGSFDVVYSNSVIEHVGDFEAQRRFAAEIRRVARRYYVQTPNYWFPIEPHIVGPNVHWLPRGAWHFVIRWLSGWGWTHRPDGSAMDEMMHDIRLLNRREVEQLFPDRTWLMPERVGGLVKSWSAARV